MGQRVEQLKALFVKDWLIRRRHWIVTLFELLMPPLLTLALLHTLPLTVTDVHEPTITIRPMKPSKQNSVEKVSDFNCYLIGDVASYTPATPEIKSFMEAINVGCDILVIPYADEDSMLANMSITTYARGEGIIFHSFDLSKRKANYTLLISEFTYTGPWTQGVWFDISTFYSLQSALNLMMASYPETNPSALRFNLTDSLFLNERIHTLTEKQLMVPVNQTNSTAIVSKVSKVDFFVMYFFLEIGFLITVAIITRRIANEKSTNCKEILRIMGMFDDIYWISHFINYFTISIFHATIITILFEFYSDPNPFGEWSPILFFIIYLMTSVSAILSTFAITTLINKPVIAILVIIAERALFAYIPISSSTSDKTTFFIPNRILSCLIPDGGFYWSLYRLAFLGNANQSPWNYFFSSTKGLENSISMGYVFLLMIFSWLIYGLLTWYLDAVWPWQPGTTKPWYFPFRRFFSKTTIENQVIDLESHDNSGLNESMTFRSESSIRCINLHKSFGSFGSKKNAVDGVNLDIMKGQITVLLGHNGAGKTTTMNMITGIIPPTSGVVLINGIDVHKNVKAARKALALCPQTNLLFEELTVEENLYLCAGLRGLTRSTKRVLIPLNISRVDLQQKVNTLASQLSGGMKRRLHLALALTTSSDILILDEPTSGLDPESRRKLWNLLLDLRKNLTILLTTHFMEEADALGDRIVIMDTGRIKCSGSPMYLKNKLGAGYLIRIAKDTIKFNIDLTENLIKSFFANAGVINNTDEEIIYRLDNVEANLITAKKLPDLCDKLDEMKTSLGILTYGINVSTLEDVFLRVCLSESDISSITKSNAINANDSMFNTDQILDYKTLDGFALTFQRLKGLIFKRFHYVKRHKKILLFTFVLPIFCIYLTFNAALSEINRTPNEETKLELNARSLYGDVQAIISTNNTVNLTPFLKLYIDVNKEKGIETKVIDISMAKKEFLDQNKINSATFMRKYLFGIIESKNQNILWYNTEATLGLQLSIDSYTNTLIRMKSGQKDSGVNTNYKKLPDSNLVDGIVKKLVVTSIISIFLPFGLCFIGASYFMFPSTEFNLKLALIQKMNGIKPLLFWSSHYLFDIFYHLIVTIIIMTVISFIDPYLFWNIQYFATTFLLFILFGLATIPLSYLISFSPLSPDAGFVYVIVATIIITCVSTVLYFLSELKLSPFFITDFRLPGFLFPHIEVNIAMATLYSNRIEAENCQLVGKCRLPIYPFNCCDDKTIEQLLDPFDKDNGITHQLVWLSISPFFYFLLVVAIDMNLRRIDYWYDAFISYIIKQKSRPVSMDDDDVAIERERVEALLKKPNYPDTLIVRDLTKDFRSLRAVDNLNFTVRQKECFGLLGVNGAGKTTTFRMLTGDLTITSGDAFIHRISLRGNLTKFQQSISYCPQYDALLSNLNPRETLALFARLRGMPESKVKVNVDFIMKSTDLVKFSKTLNRDLSGGNKRKLSLAIASIAKPDLMFLDEPTTGVDPASRRKIWSTLVHLRDYSGSSIVLTSHSMDECETLCSRIGIMARGKLRCLGSAQYLKEKFGQGFSLFIKMAHDAVNDEKKLEAIKTYIMENFPSCILRDVHQNIMQYHITDISSRWGDMLRKLEEAKLLLPIDDYTLTGTTLEQVFLSFAKKT